MTGLQSQKRCIGQVRLRAPVANVEILPTLVDRYLRVDSFCRDMIEDLIRALSPNQNVKRILVTAPRAKLVPRKDIAVGAHRHPPQIVIWSTHRTEIFHHRVTSPDDVVGVEMHAAVAIACEAIDQIRIGRMPNRALEVE